MEDAFIHYLKSIVQQYICLFSCWVTWHSDSTYIPAVGIIKPEIQEEK